MERRRGKTGGRTMVKKKNNEQNTDHSPNTFLISRVAPEYFSLISNHPKRRAQSGTTQPESDI
jgi:hypothetical protein